MSLSDYVGKDAKGEGSAPAGPVSVTIGVGKLDTLSAAARVLAAVKANDVEALNDALCLHHEAHELEYGGEGGGEGG